jgi:hypothetical protein
MLQAAGFRDVVAEDRTGQVGSARFPGFWLFGGGGLARGYELVLAQDRTAIFAPTLPSNPPAPTLHPPTPHSPPHQKFIECLTAELARVEAGRAAFEARFGAAGYEAVVGGWRDKLARARAGEQRWGLFTARKPGGAR